MMSMYPVRGSQIFRVVAVKFQWVKSIKACSNYTCLISRETMSCGDVSTRAGLGREMCVARRSAQSAASGVDRARQSAGHMRQSAGRQEKISQHQPNVAKFRKEISSFPFVSYPLI
jgi:hypothetical protein